MDVDMKSKSPDDVDGKPSFRRPSNDAGNRKYRRHSPVNESASSPSGSPKHRRSPSPTLNRRKDDGRESHKDFGRSRSGKGGDSHRFSERESYKRSSSRRDDEYRGSHRRDGEKSHQKFSSSGHETKGRQYSDYTRKESKSDRSREHRRDDDKPNEFPSSKDKVGGTSVLERHNRKESEYSNETKSERRSTNPDDVKAGGGNRDRQSRDRGWWDDSRDSSRSLGDQKNDYKSPSDSRGEGKNSTRGNGSVGNFKETHRTKELDEKKVDVVDKRKHTDRESDRRKSRFDKEPGEIDNRSYGRNERYENKTSNLDGESYSKKMKSNEDTSGRHVPKSVFGADQNMLSNSKQTHNVVDDTTAKTAQPFTTEVDAAIGLNAAKVAAMRAAELVNKNLTGGGFMSADQKKKLLWGNKKNAAPEESGHRWDTPIFSDRERQEKFNKLMSLRLHWYIWPIVGCEGRSESGRAEQPGRKPIGEAEGATTGFGEAIYCWITQERWPNCRIRSVVIILFASSSSSSSSSSPSCTSTRKSCGNFLLMDSLLL